MNVGRFWWIPAGRVKEISPVELAQMLEGNEKVQLVDVREALEFNLGHIEGARNVPLHNLRAGLDGLGLDKNTPIVALCLTGHRSIPAARFLEQAGYGRISSLKGGMINWWRTRKPRGR